MALTYKALAVLLRYPDRDVQQLAPDAAAAVAAEALVPQALLRAIGALADYLGSGDLMDLQERYVALFDRTRSLSLNLYEHVHGESRDRGQAMAALLELYRSRGLDLTANELPDHLPVFLEFLSILPAADAASLLAEASYVLAALADRLKRNDSPYAALFEALVALADDAPDEKALKALLEEAADDPSDLKALDRIWAESAVTFGPADAQCPGAGTQDTKTNTSRLGRSPRASAAA
ncbi:MAG: nitrate reductase molybdenum cofactor assembly chaperone [Alphaproteobacteria bacterium]|nr:nitrate reductase molybdenum cofactor assembly chaperone [Alphaproteobacteria bacterium]